MNDFEMNMNIRDLVSDLIDAIEELPPEEREDARKYALKMIREPGRE